MCRASDNNVASGERSCRRRCVRHCHRPRNCPVRRGVSRELCLTRKEPSATREAREPRVGRFRKIGSLAMHRAHHVRDEAATIDARCWA